MGWRGVDQARSFTLFMSILGRGNQLLTGVGRLALYMCYIVRICYINFLQVWSDLGVSSHVTLVSVAGGERDVMIPTHLTSIPGAITISVT